MYLVLRGERCGSSNTDTGNGQGGLLPFGALRLPSSGKLRYKLLGPGRPATPGTGSDSISVAVLVRRYFQRGTVAEVTSYWPEFGILLVYLCSSIKKIIYSMV